LEIFNVLGNAFQAENFLEYWVKHIFLSADLWGKSNYSVILLGFSIKDQRNWHKNTSIVEQDCQEILQKKGKE